MIIFYIALTLLIVYCAYYAYNLHTWKPETLKDALAIFFLVPAFWAGAAILYLLVVIDKIRGKG